MKTPIFPAAAAALILSIILLTLSSCSLVKAGGSDDTETAVRETEPQKAETPETEAPETESPETEVPETKAPETEAPETEAEETVPVSFEPTAASVSYANAVKNGVQGRFTDPGRSAFEIKNLESSLVCGLKGDFRGVCAFNSAGVGFSDDTIDSYVRTSDGITYLSSKSYTAGTMNSYRLGYYYYDFRIQDLGFAAGDEVQSSSEAEPIDHLQNTGSKWGKNDVKDVGYSDHTLTYTVKSDYDPYIWSSCDFSADTYTSVHMKIRTETATGGQFFIIAGDMNAYNAPQSVSYTLDAGEWNDITIPINVVPDYSGRVTGFRIDVGAANGEKVEISAVEFVGDGPRQAPVKLERILHTYPDKTHEHMRIVASASSDVIAEYGETITLAADTVASVMIADGSGFREWDGGETLSGVFAAAAEVRDVGIIGYIIPDMYLPGELMIERSGENIVITHRVTRSGRLPQGLSQSLAHRLYISGAEDFGDFAEAVRIERNPLTVTAVSGDGAGSKGYDPYSGQYIVTLGGSDFNKAYYDEPDREYSVTFYVNGDGTPRKLYIESYAPNGGLECGALLDSGGKLLPIPVEVSKNFCGEYEEPFYDPADDSYGETRFVMMSGGGDQRLTVLNLYQNWGATPLRQLSSIQFHIPYYHLSYGVTETNCIAPYFVSGKDGWTLPDFRAQSAPLWPTQPQHTSVGRLYLPYYTDVSGKTVRSELQTSVIDSAGPIYPDVTMNYLLDDGKITASYRHLEMPWSDENRTMYSFRIDVNGGVEIADFRRDFRLFGFDGRGLTFTRLGYLDENNAEKAKELSGKGAEAEDGGYIKLGSECPYFDYYLVSPETDTVNFGLIIKSSDIVIGGEKFEGPFVLRDTRDGSMTNGSLSLDIGGVTLKKGDHIYIDLILIPWGTTDTPDDSSVRLVRQDTCLDPYRIDVQTGYLIEDPWLPKIRCENGEAKFTVSGGSCGTESGNTLAVRVYGFEKPDRISVSFGGESAHITPDEYEDMQVYLDGDGSYSFAFAVTPELISKGPVEIECRQ